MPVQVPGRSVCVHLSRCGTQLTTKRALSDIPAAKKKYVPTSGTYPRGFRVSGTYVGVKASNKGTPDLAFITSDTPCAAAAVFTRNKFQAAPVTFSRALLQRRRQDGFRGVLINSGCANAVTGRGGLEDAEAMARRADGELGAEDATIVMSTGVIGQRLPIQKILGRVGEAHRGLGADHRHWMDCASAICTTDTFPKLLSRTFALPSRPGVEYRIAGMAKGAGMIHPNMATLLGVMATDAPVAPQAIPALLRRAVDRSFNCVTIDGDTSTNDTVVLLANGAAGGPPVGSSSSSSEGKDEDLAALGDVLTAFATDLAKLVARDGEGATKFVTVRVADASCARAAHAVAGAIARSPLVKTALYGRDANWGRIACAAGYALVNAGADDGTAVVVPERTNISFVPSAESGGGGPELRLLVDGEPEAVDEARAAEILAHEDLEILVRLGTGKEEATYYTCDLSHEYVTINGDYRT
ncbi:hypothetical protein GGR56DRAFT_682074 [Xylariaceae sp. FL0804]|nr:hypothetical protein GGR56DRAFT_682074 [Xylariaceae sp. FL0804]